MSKIDKPLNKALIIFSDIVDSSVYSSIMGIEQYGKELIRFQRNFEALANSYFPEVYAIRKFAEGDEGSVFYILDEGQQESPSNLIYRAIEFSFMLKATMELVIQPEETSPKKMHIGTGIHLGDVATVLNTTKDIGETNNIAEVDKILGYSINYAKRVESASRIGSYSKVFVSKTASAYLWEHPVVLEKHKHDLKGISQAEDVFEVRSAYLLNLSLEYAVERVDNFLMRYVTEPHKLDFISEPWLKGFILSVLDAVIRDSKFISLKEKYGEKRYDLAWRYFADDDPIVLMMRANYYERNGPQTRRLSILKDVIENYPTFVYGQIEFVKAISKILDDKTISSEVVYARDIAIELLDKYGSALVVEETAGEFKEIIERINTKLGRSGT